MASSTWDATGAKVLRRADTAGNFEDFDLQRARYGVGVSWDTGSVDIDLQCVVVDRAGVIIDCAYYNNLKAARGVTHSGDATVGKPNGIQELVWVTLPKLPENVAVLIFVVAAYSGGLLRDVHGGKLRILEDSQKKEIAQFDLERSAASVDVVGAMFRGPNNWFFRVIDEPAVQGQHFMDILPLLSDTIRLFLPQAPRRQKVAFAMQKGSVLDLPQDMSRIIVGLGWDTGNGEVDLDVSAVLLDENSLEVDAVFFGRLESEEHGITHSGDNLTGEGDGDDEQIVCLLPSIGPRVQQIFFCVNIFTQRKTFQQVANPYCRVIDSADGSSGVEICRYALSDAGSQNGLLIAKLAREAGGRWGFHALGLPCNGKTYKDSVPEIRRVATTKTASLMRRGTTHMEFGGAPSAPSAPPAAYGAPPAAYAVPVAQPPRQQKQGCLVQ